MLTRGPPAAPGFARRLRHGCPEGLEPEDSGERWYAPALWSTNMNALKLRRIGFGFAVISLAWLAAGRLAAQAPAAAPPDYSKVEIQTTQLAPNFYRFEAVGPVLVGNA